MGRFVLKAPYQARGDQPQAIRALAEGIDRGLTGQTLLGVTGSGKTFTMASVIGNGVNQFKHGAAPPFLPDDHQAS